jgi:hypothetical protein
MLTFQSLEALHDQDRNWGIVMKRVVIGIVLGLVLAAAAFFVWRMMAPPPADLDLSRTKLSQAGLYRVSVTPESEPFDRSRMHNWVVTIDTASGEPVAGAQVDIDGGMPQHGHGLPTAPRVSATETPGRYLLQGIRFGMPGWWVVELEIDAPAGRDRVEFNLSL